MLKSKRLTSKRGITLPKDLCEYVGLSGGEAVDITAQSDGSVIIRKHTPVCRFCGDRSSAQTYHGIDICPSCADKLRSEVIK